VSASSVSEHVSPLPLDAQAPPHPANVDPVFAVCESTTVVPGA